MTAPRKLADDEMVIDHPDGVTWPKPIPEGWEAVGWARVVRCDYTATPWGRPNGNSLLRTANDVVQRIVVSSADGTEGARALCNEVEAKLNAPALTPEAQALIDAALTWWEQSLGGTTDEYDALIDAVEAYRQALTEGSTDD